MDIRDDSDRQRVNGKSLVNHDHPEVIEIWNLVFIEFNRLANGSLVKLPAQHVDTGMGFERLTMALQGKKSNYDTDIFQPLIQEIARLAHCTYGNNEEKDIAMRVIADHLRAVSFAIADGQIPSNTGAGYVIRRILRRAVRYGFTFLGFEEPFVYQLLPILSAQMAANFPEIATQQNLVSKVIFEEESSFLRTLAQGIKRFEQYTAAHTSEKLIDGSFAFELFDTYGFPIELTEELAGENGLAVNRAEFDEAFKKHQELSRAGSEQVFKGGLADHSEKTTAYHTATHLLQKALRMVLGDHVGQKGSNITADRMRFDFTHPEPMTAEQIATVEKIVNEQISADLPVTMEIMPIEEAKKSGAMALFGDKYEDVVKVYSIGSFSREVCGGPHVERTGGMGTFKIVKEQSSSAGVRRIRAVLDNS